MHQFWFGKDKTPTFYVASEERKSNGINPASNIQQV